MINNSGKEMDDEIDFKGLEDRREFLRVEVCFPIAVVVCSQQTYKKEKEFIRAHPTAERDQNFSSLIFEEDLKKIDPAVVKMWVGIERKMDHIINLLEKKGDKEGPAKTFGACVDLSMTGIKVLSNYTLKVGQIVKVDIRPPTFPGLSVTAIGDVLRIEKSEVEGLPGTQYGIGFKVINDEDRERLVRYIFKRQRELIRSKE